ncbi:hypothetical protein [Pareuzebyella sediminis]|uniref:hypothetical protein n=1 Tax=Pareuzebyella sediminis TaxID=2607998 RepID=UPI001E5B3DA8|nr:hypothetical protein [Pareuzebyella sediminis]
MKIENPYFSDARQDYVYKATINAFDQRLGGLLIIKKIGLEHHRVVFTTEMGNTIFDFTLQGSDFKVNQILKEIDRKIVLDLFRKDFEILIKEQAPVTKSFTDGSDLVLELNSRHKKHYYFYVDNQLKKIARTGNGNEKVSFLFSGIKGNIAREIRIDHSNIDLKIALKAL